MVYYFESLQLRHVQGSRVVHFTILEPIDDNHNDVPSTSNKTRVVTCLFIGLEHLKCLKVHTRRIYSDSHAQLLDKSFVYILNFDMP